MKTYSELGHVHRCEPCVEYPGQWIVYCQGETSSTHASFEAAYKSAAAISDATCERVSISWACSDDDPRIGQVWFTGYYCAGHFDQFNRWVQS